MAPITVARKQSQDVCSRTLRKRSKQTEEVIGVISGTSSQAISTQTSHFVNRLDAVEREKILNSFKHSVSIPAEHVAAMKSTLVLPWNLMRDVRRWLSTFKVNLASEGRARNVVKEWVGEGLHCEEIPASVRKDNRVVIKLKPWAYIYNLVGYVLKYLEDLEKNNLIYQHPFIPEGEIHLKIGGDHGGGSFKMSFQIGNVQHPNKPENTVIFSIMEAKDLRSNLILCLERFKLHIDKFRTIKWNNQDFVIFLFGDYEFLCCMYGLSGASGTHPCLWCKITTSMLSVPVSVRGKSEERSLESLAENLKIFRETYKGVKSKAQKAFNVINDMFFKIPLTHVCIPGLHITLGVVLKIVKHLELLAKKWISR